MLHLNFSLFKVSSTRHLFETPQLPLLSRGTKRDFSRHMAKTSAFLTLCKILGLVFVARLKRKTRLTSVRPFVMVTLVADFSNLVFEVDSFYAKSGNGWRIF